MTEPRFPAGAHGGDGERLARTLGIPPSDVLDLSLSLNPVAPDMWALVAGHLDALGRYPDPTEATRALAGALVVDPERVVLTNGGSEAIALVAAELGGGRVDEPDFSLYPRDKTGPRWRSNPHNPTGLLAAPDEPAGVWDEAFYPLATGRWTRGDADRGAIVVGSLTKVFACPGLRAGYVLAPDVAFADRVRARQPEWSLNGLATAAIPELLATAELTQWRDEIARLRTALVEMLHTHGLASLPSDANWVLVPGASDLRDALACEGVLVRDCTSFGWPDRVRIAVPDPAGLTRLDTALSSMRP